MPIIGTMFYCLYVLYVPCSLRAGRPWGRPSLLYNGYRVPFAGVRRPGRGVDCPPPPSAEVKERVELYLCFPFGPSWRAIKADFTFTFMYFFCAFSRRMKELFYSSFHLRRCGIMGPWEAVEAVCPCLECNRHLTRESCQVVTSL